MAQPPSKSRTVVVIEGWSRRNPEVLLGADDLKANAQLAHQHCEPAAPSSTQKTLDATPSDEPDLRPARGKNAETETLMEHSLESFRSRSRFDRRCRRSRSRMPLIWSQDSPSSIMHLPPFL
eukprot:5779798-Pyramimonas_sp.AAC.1